MKKKQLIIGGCIAVLVLLLIGAWHLWFSPTKIAFVNYQVISLGQISKSNDNSFIKIAEVGTDELKKLSSYDMVFINAMGLRITEEQRAQIQREADRGLPILTIAATNPANRIISLDSVRAEKLSAYLSNGGRRNYRSMLNYVRKHIDGKIFLVNEPEAVVERTYDMIYHIDPRNPEDEELGFNTVAEYDAFLQKHGLLKEDAPRIVVTGEMGDPTDLIRRLEETGNVVYPVHSMKSFIDGHHIDSVQQLSAVINMAHGRMGDYMVDYLTKQNIPLFCPLNVNCLVEEWEEDKMGMSGGFLSQSVVTPEIDGAIRPYALFGHYKDAEGLQHVSVIPERLETFVETVNNYIKLQRKPNSEKRIAIYYYKGPGQNAMTAAGMEVTASLYNMLCHMKQEGYQVEGLPASSRELEQMIQAKGVVFGTYAEGALDNFMKNGHPELITRKQYESWVQKAIRPEQYEEVVDAFAEFPGEYMATEDGQLGVARLQFGNVVLLPQNAAGKGDNAFKVVHGTDAAPPHNYIASYLWAQYGFKADAMIHFGTHGSLEFTPKKQVALSSDDWPDCLVGAMPHFYIYSIADVGEGMIAKRRSYGGLQSYLTPPFLESSVRGIYSELMEKIKVYNNLASLGNSSEAELRKASLTVKEYTEKLGIHRELELDSSRTEPYTEEEIMRVENFAEELANEKITGKLYDMGTPYEPESIKSSVYAMSTDPIAYSLLALDKLRNNADENTEMHRALFTRQYLNPARDLVTRLLANPALCTDELICYTAGITLEELAEAREIEESCKTPQDMMSMMIAMAAEAPAKSKQYADIPSKQDTKPAHSGLSESARKKMKEMAKGMEPEKAMEIAKKMGAGPEALKKMQASMAEHPSDSVGQSAQTTDGMEAMMKLMTPKKEYTREEINFATAVMEVERTIKNVNRYRQELQESPRKELFSLTNALNGGYTPPSPGGDPIVNPNALPTGRNLYGINAEATPSKTAWEKGKLLADNTIDLYKRRHNDSIPRKVSYTLWSGEFIETEGATIAQVLYMLGVEPIWDAFGRVTDLRLIPSEELGRSRIDVVVQTSGQLRDIAASRLFLINRAVEMAANAKEDQYENQVSVGVLETERILIEKGLTPKDAREISTYRVFGGLNGGYGTGIQEMVMSSDRWESEDEIADTYLNNMGAYYGSEKNWEAFRQYAFEAALDRTDAVIQPRQSNTWGALSLDHVYEFMGGLNLAVRNVTGKEPDAYLSDYRNRNNFRMQEVKEAIGVESRTTLFNPTYIKEKMKGEAGSANTFAEIVQNIYGWNVMKPKSIDKEMWDEIYNVYVKDKFDLGIQEYFEEQNPAALEEITAVMLETVRKGMWHADEQQVADIVKLHTDLVNKYQPSCSGFVCDNNKLQQFIASKSDAQTAAQYSQNINRIREAAVNDRKGMVMKKEEKKYASEKQTNILSNTMVGVMVLITIIVLLMLVRHRRKKMEK